MAQRELTTQKQKLTIDEALSALLDVDKVERFDASILDDFISLLYEAYGIQSLQTTNVNIDAIRKYLKLKKTDTLITMVSLLKEQGYDSWPQETTNEMKRNHEYSYMPAFEYAKGIKFNNSEISRKLINDLRRQMQRTTSDYKKDVKLEDFWTRPETEDVWTRLFKSLRTKDVINDDSQIFIVEPRWPQEVLFFRNILGFKNTIGISLYSDDENLIKVGDVHRPSLTMSTFDVIFLKNALSYSYDPRGLLNTCFHLLKDNGVLIIDNVFDYTIGVNEVVRSNVTSTRWLTNFFKNNCAEILYDKETKVDVDWANKIGQYAIMIKK